MRQGTIKKTICKSGWTKTIRPPISYPNTLKLKEDHLIPLELGGAPRKAKNLWPEPRSQSKLSDPLETQLKRKVYKGLMKLAKARATIRVFKFTNGYKARFKTIEPTSNLA